MINHLQEAAVVVRRFHVDEPMQITLSSKNLFVCPCRHISPDCTVGVVHECPGELPGFGVEPILTLPNPVDNKAGVAGMQQLTWSLVLSPDGRNYCGGSCHC